MLLDESGELKPVRLDSSFVTSENAVIVLDEYHDTCWVWIGKNVGMPTRMHALRMGKSVQKAGHKVGTTTIGMASSRIVEINEKSETDPEVASSISSFREALRAKWKFEDEILAFDESRVTGGPPLAARRMEARAPEAPPTLTATTVAASSRPPPPPPRQVPPTPSREPKASIAPMPPKMKPAAPEKADTTVEQKLAYLLLSTIKNSDLVYTERFERNGKIGFKIEAPGIVVVEAILDGNTLRIDPPSFGDSEGASRIRSEYESWMSKT